MKQKKFNNKARKILLDAFWTPVGHRLEPELTETDRQYAIDAGYMFEPFDYQHDKLVEMLLEEVKLADVTAMADAFIASLGSRRLDQRSALGSYGFARNFPDHKFDGVAAGWSYSEEAGETIPCGVPICAVCSIPESPVEPAGEKLDTLNFERYKWGGVRHFDPIYAWFDLRQFRQFEKRKPNEEDYRILHEIFAKIVDFPPDATSGKLAKALQGIFRSNIAERQILVQILGMSGILSPSERSGFADEFTNHVDRHHTGQHNNDSAYPVIWWRGSDRLNIKMVERYFPSLFAGN